MNYNRICCFMLFIMAEQVIPGTVFTAKIKFLLAIQLTKHGQHDTQSKFLKLIEVFNVCRCICRISIG